MRHRSFAWIVLAALVLTTGASAAGPDGKGAGAGRLVGTWLVRVDFPPFSPFQYLQHFDRDGRTTLLLTWGVPPCAEADPPTCEPPEYWQGDTRVGCMGEWTHRGRRTFDVTMYCLPHQGDGYIPDRIRIQAVLSNSGKSFNGDGFTYEAFDPDTGEVIFGGEGAMDGHRLPHVPFP